VIGVNGLDVRDFDKAHVIAELKAASGAVCTLRLRREDDPVVIASRAMRREKSSKVRSQGAEAVAKAAVGAVAKGHKTKRDRDASKDALQVAGMSVKELKKVITDGGLSHADCFEKSELRKRAGEALEKGRIREV
jgi:hypothetical protein